jgi:SSS family solute:Na+ symporter
MITGYDKFIIGFYLIFVLVLGLVFRRLSRNTSDYFRCGGAMPWWITGVSAWIAGFSAWTFTGAAGKIYETGTLVLVLYYASLLPTFIILIYTGKRFRRMRVVTYMEAVRQRYGRGTEQFYTWIKLPLMLIFSGVGLNAIGVFMSAVFHVNMFGMLIVLGTTVTIVALVGGAWAVLASDFVQMLLVVTITLVAAYLAIHQPSIGSIKALIDKSPHSAFHWMDLARPQVVWLWVLGLCWIKMLDGNNIENATMYLMVKNDRDAKRMVLIPLIGTLIGPLIWMIPSMTARITHPNIAGEYSQLVQPTEAAFVAVARDVMPQGLIALLICAMFGATLTSMDAGLNKGVGIFVRNFYRPLINPDCPEKQLLLIGKCCTAIFGAIIVAMALVVNRFRSSGLFDLTNQLAASLAFPLMIPLAYGMFFKRTPGWSGWSTAVAGFLSSLAVQRWVSPEGAMHLLGIQGKLSVREVTDFHFYATILINTAVCTVWFFGTSLFYNRDGASRREQVENLFDNLKTPIDTAAEGVGNYDTVLYRMIGMLCLVYGSFVLLLILIPNSTRGRLCFLFCGGFIFLTGLVLFGLSRRKGRPADEATAADVDPLQGMREGFEVETKAGRS